ncbi:MAG: hypothetical protein CMJ64_08570 [Planctomycetaceae bacterium]|nr:hypothetical protein [Planctomycetaceae bacterium]
MPIHDLGYRAWEGKPASHVMRWAVIANTGIRLAWKSYWLRRLMFISWIPVVGMGIFLFIFENSLDHPTERAMLVRFVERNPFIPPLNLGTSPDEGEARREAWSSAMLLLFRYPQLVAMLFVVGLIAPTLISGDMQSRAFLLYFSRPIERTDYLIGKSAIVWFYLAMITTLPALALYVLGASLSPDLSVVAYTWDIPLRILGASIWLMLPTTAVALCFSSMTMESRYAAVGWVAIWVLGWVAYGILAPLSGSALDSQWSLLSFHHTLGRVQAWIFGVERNFGDVLPSIVMLILVTGGATTLLLQRISSPMRI